MKDWIANKTYYKYEKEKSILRMGGKSWTINLGRLAEFGEQVEQVIYVTHDKDYQISFADALEKGFERDFQGEKKLVVPLRHWKVIEKNVVV